MVFAPRSLKTTKQKWGFHQVDYFLEVGNLNHPKLGLLLMVGWTSRVCFFVFFRASKFENIIRCATSRLEC